MKAAVRSRRDRIRSQLADLKMPGALESLDDVLTGVDGGGVTASEAIEERPRCPETPCISRNPLHWCDQRPGRPFFKSEALMMLAL